MQTKSRLFDDLAKVAGGAVTTLAGVKAEIDGLVRQRIERLLTDADMVPRDEFDAVKAMAAKARAAQDTLEKRIQSLEKKLGRAGDRPGKPSAPKRKRKRRKG